MSGTAVESVDAAAVTRGQRRRAVFASTVGTSIEWYDFFLYGTAAALVFPDLFFPDQSKFAGILLSYGTQFVGFAARPIGAAIFGHFGDRIGRKGTLVATLLLMGVGTFLIGCLPTYASIGVLAPVLLVLLRVAQGLGVGGEWGGSVLLAMEWGSRKRRGLMASFPQMGVPMGLLLATAAVKLMGAWTGDSFMTWGWRVPFLLSAVLVGDRPLRAAAGHGEPGVRGRAPAGDGREDAGARGDPHPAPRDPHLGLRPALGAGAVLPLHHLRAHLRREHVGMDKGALLNFTLVAAAIGLVSVPLFGYFSDLIGRRLMYGIGIVGTAVFAFPYYGLLDTGKSGFVLLAIVASLIFHDMQYGPQAALIAERFGTNVRYSGAGLGYQLASVIAGGPAPLIAAKILEDTGSSTWISWYIVGCCAIAMIALISMPARREMPEDEKVLDLDDVAARRLVGSGHR